MEIVYNESIQRINAGLSHRDWSLRMPSLITLPPNACICRQLECRISYGQCHCGCGAKTPVAKISNTAAYMINNEPMRYIQGHGTRSKHTLPEGLCICRKPACGIPFGTCHCGCGSQVSLARSSRGNIHINGMPQPYKEGHTSKTSTTVNRLLKYRIIDESSQCWIWTKAKDKDGYGLMTVADIMRRVPAVSYETFVGKIPDGLIIRHKCDNPPCFNPDHLETGTQKQNRQDAFERGRLTAEMIGNWIRAARSKKKGKQNVDG